ncbi:MAG: antiterminator LoaP [Beduini sp.]|uniref:antiterminator LoaP n=1 Tax=Beduini sp. TaxID=1922300 RepID=UPI0039A0BA55
MNWYVIQVRSGHEKEIADKCRSLISKEVLQDCFIPEYYVQKKFHGQWHKVKQILFKGYVFLISDHIEELFNELKKIPDFTKVIGKKKEEIYPLKEEEVVFLVNFSKEDHIVDMSIGYIEGEQIYVTEGPLKGKEGMIQKIDRHKRMAYIQVSLFNEETTAKVGLEIISKN